MRRKRIDRLRHAISAWSPRGFAAAQSCRLPGLYQLWARWALAVDRVLAYAGGRER